MKPLVLVIRRPVLATLALAVILAWLVWVWPTPYIYLTYGSRPVRINRITGSYEVMTPVGWFQSVPPSLP